MMRVENTIYNHIMPFELGVYIQIYIREGGAEFA